MASERRLGPNHADGCSGEDWRYSGGGYNRVRLCTCGAEDHDPEPGWMRMRPEPCAACGGSERADMGEPYIGSTARVSVPCPACSSTPKEGE